TTIFAEMSALAVKTGALNLGQGFPDTDGPSEVSEAAMKAIAEGHNQYPPGPGIEDLRLAIAEHQARFWNVTVDPATEVLVTAGATEALAATLLGLCEIGDEVVVFDPTYDSYRAGIAMAGAVVRGVLLRPPEPDEASSHRFTFDRDELAKAFSAKTRLVLLNTPHNPTGKVFTEEELAFIAELCVEHDVVAVTDEVYEHLVFDGARHRPLCTFPGMAERTLTISSGGKTFSFTGWKIGWAVGPAEIVAAVRTAKQFLTFVSGAPFQPAIATGLRLGDDYFERFLATMQHKRDLLCPMLDEAGFGVLVPEGTYFVTADISPLGFDDSIEFCLRLPELAGVVAVPSAVFYQDGDNGAHLVRFCFAKRDEVLTEAGTRLIDALA
ncbi:MAG: pyridoxal phosphate-dependent aminotransferase, partial [Acidimicrobiales bacterium]